MGYRCRDFGEPRAEFKPCAGNIAACNPEMRFDGEPDYLSRSWVTGDLFRPA